MIIIELTCLVFEELNLEYLMFVDFFSTAFDIFSIGFHTYAISCGLRSVGLGKFLSQIWSRSASFCTKIPLRPSKSSLKD